LLVPTLGEYIENLARHQRNDTAQTWLDLPAPLKRFSLNLAVQAPRLTAVLELGLQGNVTDGLHVAHLEGSRQFVVPQLIGEKVSHRNPKPLAQPQPCIDQDKEEIGRKACRIQFVQPRMNHVDLFVTQDIIDGSAADQMRRELWTLRSHIHLSFAV